MRLCHGLDIQQSVVKSQLEQLSLGHKSNENVTVYDHFLQEK